MHFVMNLAAFKVGWLSSVVGGANQLPWLGPIAVLVAVSLHLYRAERPQRELLLIGTCGVIGAAFDSMLVSTGWVSYSSGVFLENAAPYWIIAMWMLFGTTLNVSLQWLKANPLVAALTGLIAGPLSYLAGQKLGGIELVNQPAALATLAVGWALMMPLLMQLATRMDGVRAVR